MTRSRTTGPLSAHGRNKYKEPVSENRKKIKLDRKTGRQIELGQGPLCSYVIGCRDQLIKEEQEATP